MFAYLRFWCCIESNCLRIKDCLKYANGRKERWYDLNIIEAFALILVNANDHKGKLFAFKTADHSW